MQYMSKLAVFNKWLEKIMPLLTPGSVAIGVLSSSWLQSYTFLAPWVFAFMTFAGSLGSGFREMFQVLMRPLPVLVNLVILHAFMPLVAWGLGSLFFPDDIHAVTGFILAMIIPTGVSSLLWTSIYMGNMALTLSIIVIDTLLSPLLVPLGISLLLGTAVEMEMGEMVRGMFFMIVLPSLAEMTLNHVTRGRVKQTVAPALAPFSKLSMGVIVAINSSVVAPYLTQVDEKLVKTAALVFVLATCGFVVGWLVGRLFRWKRDVIVTLAFNSGMRNIGAGSVLAIAYFPPAVALPVVLGMLFQQSLAALFGQFLRVVEKEEQTAPVQAVEKRNMNM